MNCTRRSSRRAACSLPASSISTSATSLTRRSDRHAEISSAQMLPRAKPAGSLAGRPSGGAGLEWSARGQSCSRTRNSHRDPASGRRSPPQEARHRFQTAVQGLPRRLRDGKEHPLALFLDDLQWLDTARSNAGAPDCRPGRAARTDRRSAAKAMVMARAMAHLGVNMSSLPGSRRC